MNYSKIFNDIFNDLGIKVSPLPQNYSPDNYSKELMQNVPRPKRIAYSSATLQSQSKEKVSD